MRVISGAPLLLAASASALAVLAFARPAAAMVERAARASSRDVKIPRALVARIERDYKAFLAAQEGASDKGIKRALLNVSVVFTAKRPGALREDTRVDTPIGGGLIDLSEIVTPLRGAFRVRIDARGPGEETEARAARVYFVSHARKRVLAGDEYGAGCDKFMDITSEFRQKWKRGGFEMYTADQRYLSVLGGTFLFVQFRKEALFVAGVTFTDSRYPDVMCE
jgi:hypothetical protein